MIRSLVDPRGVLLAGAFMLVGGCSSSPPQTSSAHGLAPPTPAVVSNVLAPDTVNVTFGTNSILVRILGIRTPQPTAQGQPDGCGWPGALGYAQQRLANEHVTLVSDPNQPGGDPQGRNPRYLRLSDGSDYSTTVVAAGWARAELDPRHPLQEGTQLRAAEATAQDAHRALWGMCPAVTSQQAASEFDVGHAPGSPDVSDPKNTGGPVLNESAVSRDESLSRMCSTGCAGR
jgi:micrococcal nuclease